MKNYLHNFFIPVMGTGHSVDTPLKVAPYGISSVVSLVDDILLENLLEYYSNLFELPLPTNILENDSNLRSQRITNYLNMLCEIVTKKFNEIKSQPFFTENDKKKYFDMLPDSSSLKKLYNKLLRMEPSEERTSIEKDLNNKMLTGSIDVNIMVKLDAIRQNIRTNDLSSEFSDAKTALKGYAESMLKSSIVFSAGINQTLFSYMTRFKDFYRDKTGDIKKKIVLKVSDFRSALIQGKFLAKKGLEVHEFRIESGLNCGGHAFPTNGRLLPLLIKEFKEKKEQLAHNFQPLILKYYKSMGWEYPEKALSRTPLITVQGGIGNVGEAKRMIEEFSIDSVGFATPFLFVPEATTIDDSTLELLQKSKRKDFYLSNASPLGVPFNNLRDSGSSIFTAKLALSGKPGSPCKKGFLISNTEFTKKPVCTASIVYQKKKIDEINKLDITESDKESLRQNIYQKACICDHLGNSCLIKLGIKEEKNSPQAICPSNNAAWFDRIYTLKEMVDHIFGRIPSLVPHERPHMFMTEIDMYIKYFQKQTQTLKAREKELKNLEIFKNNLSDGIYYCIEIAKGKPYLGENLESILNNASNSLQILDKTFLDFKNKVADTLNACKATICSYDK